VNFLDDIICIYVFRVAVKMISCKFPENELRIMQECDSPFIVKLLETFFFYSAKVGTVYGIVMEYYEVFLN